MDAVHRIFNLVEAGFWFLLAVFLLSRGRVSPPRYKPLILIGGLACAAFAGTDIIESESGAWYEPRWLLVYNAICLAVMLVCVVRYVILRRSADYPGEIEFEHGSPPRRRDGHHDT